MNEKPAWLANFYDQARAIHEMSRTARETSLGAGLQCGILAAMHIETAILAESNQKSAIFDASTGRGLIFRLPTSIYNTWSM